jgi:iron complex transport system permease protein
MLHQAKPLTGTHVLKVISLLTVILVICMGLGTAFGAGTILISNLLPGNNLTEVEQAIMFEVRLPRVLVAGLLGGALSIAGVVFQALLRNPLADPYVLGVSGGASIGGVVALLLGLGTAGSLLGDIAVPAFAFAGALGALLLIESIATVGGQLTVYTILLTGAIFNAFSAALIYFIQSIASLQQLHEIVFYLMGRVPSLGYWNLCVLAIAIILASFALLLLGRNYNALSLGEESAMQLGVDIEKLKRYTFVLGSLLTGLCVAVAGLIGFVGLVVPHMLRMVLGSDHRLLLPAAFLGGAGFLVLADLAARLMLAPNELPVGVVTAIIGGPFFLYLLRTRSQLYGFQ